MHESAVAERKLTIFALAPGSGPRGHFELLAISTHTSGRIIPTTGTGGPIRRVPMENVHPPTYRGPTMEEETLYVTHQFTPRTVGLRSTQDETLLVDRAMQ